MKRLRVSQAIVALSLLLSTLVSTQQAVADDGYVNPIPQQHRQAVWSTPEYDDAAIAASNKVNYGLAFSGGLETRMQGTNIRAYASNGDQSRLCDMSLKCADSQFNRVEALGALDLCSNAKAAPCVESLEYKIGDGAYSAATFDFAVDPSPTASDIANLRANGATSVQLKSGWGSNAFAGVPASAAGPLVFHFANAKNQAGTDTYALESAFTFQTTSGGNSGQITHFHVSLIPVLDDPSAHCEAQWYEYQLNGHPATNGIGCANDQKAYFSSKSIGWAAGFPAYLTVRLKLRLNQSLGGWFQGRVDNPSVKIDSIAGQENLVTIEASPTSVPTTAAPIPLYDPANSGIIQTLGIVGDFWDSFKAQDGKSPGMLLTTGDGWTPARGGAALIGQLGDQLGNKAKGQISVWEFKRLTASGKCLDENTSLQGLLTTNAMTYQPALPSLQDGFLNYSVAGLHYDSSGAIFQGTYNFIMRDSVARCLYGFSGKGPISGTVSVTSSDGSENVATTAVNDDGEWLRLSALGFTFSNPTIRAKLSQPADPGTASSVTPSPNAQIKSIRCVHGKLLKTVVGKNPKCPAGFKKK